MKSQVVPRARASTGQQDLLGLDRRLGRGVHPKPETLNPKPETGDQIPGGSDDVPRCEAHQLGHHVPQVFSPGTIVVVSFASKVGGSHFY